MKKKTKDIKRLTLRQDVIRILTSIELKTVIGGAGGAGTSSTHSKDDGSPTTC